MSYSDTYLFGKAKKKDKKQYRDLYTYLVLKKPVGIIYLSDGPLEYLLVAVISLSSNATILVNSNYPEKRLFFKHLVLNNQ
jgi:predicted ATPase